MDADKRTVYEFGDFVLESGRRRLLRRDSGEPIALTAKAFDTLLHLVEHRGETLDKDTLLGAIWPGVVVEENNLTQSVSALRQVLGETRAENRYIATIPRKGYRFVGEVTERIALAAPVVPATPADPVGADKKRSLRPLWWSVAALAVLVAIGTVLVQRGRVGNSALSARSIAASGMSPALGGTKDSIASLHYASGRYALARSTEPSLVLGIGYFEKAIERDPQFALAYEGLADCYMVLGVFGMRAPTETLPRARDAVLRALQIEPRLAGAYGTLGHIKMQYDRDWAGAEADFAHAIALNPSLSEPHLYWGVLLGMRGELDRGLEELRQAQQLAPLLTVARTRIASLLYFARRYDEAVVQIKESLALDDRPGIAHALLGRVYLHTGRYDLALAEFAQIHGPTPGSFGDIGQALALSGRRAEALAELDRVLKLSTQRYVSAGDIASIYASLGDTDNALMWLDRALQQRASLLGFLAQNPTFDGLHNDPRFAAIVDRVGIWKRPLTDSPVSNR
ncbi:MAG TPA: winged helix-turn-helix domain-containing protein [Steroidobacteraceae bacterium]